MRKKEKRDAGERILDGNRTKINPVAYVSSDYVTNPVTKAKERTHDAKVGVVSDQDVVQAREFSKENKK